MSKLVGEKKAEESILRLFYQMELSVEVIS